MNGLISVVIPIYNQYSKLIFVLQHFARQTIRNSMFEVIIVDDGSTDVLKDVGREELRCQCNIENLELIHIPNSGRAAARNKGVDIAQGEYIVFCDGDRVPKADYLQMYREAASCHDIIVGGPMDYFGSLKLLEEFNDEKLMQYARYPQYYKSVCEDLFDREGNQSSPWAWLGFMVGNSCVKKQVLNDVGGFSLDFSTWGFEHFELAYRLMQAGLCIYNNRAIISFHLVHSRSAEFYNTQINNSLVLMEKKHQVNKAVLTKLFFDQEEKYNFKMLMEVEG